MNQATLAKKLADHLTALTAGWRQGCGDDQDLSQLAMALRNGFRNCHLFRANTTTESGVLDVATAEQLTLKGLHRGAHRKSGIRRIGLLAGTLGEFPENALFGEWGQGMLLYDAMPGLENSTLNHCGGVNADSRNRRRREGIDST
jgi:hypothetical protein